jgi:hypothetical protein
MALAATDRVSLALLVVGHGLFHLLGSNTTFDDRITGVTVNPGRIFAQ